MALYMEFNFFIFTVSGRTVKLKSINCVKIHCITAMTSSTKLGFVKLTTLNLKDLEANRKILLL